MTFEMLGKRLVAGAKKAVTAFAKEHGDVVVTAFAFDADPYNEFFACCFDVGTTRSVGAFRHHLFYELELPVHAQLPKGGAPATKCGDQTSVPVIAAWIASRRNPDDPAIDAAKRALARLAKAKKQRRP